MAFFPFGRGRRSTAPVPQAPSRLVRKLQLAGLFAATVIALSALAFTSPWSLVELRGFDYLSTIDRPALAQKGPVIVAIDEPSLAEIPHQWPWPRALHGQLVTQLRAAGAKVIGLDILFAEPAADPQNDAALEAALGADVVLAADETLIVTPMADQLLRTEPLERFVSAGAHPGVASVGLSPDGVIRQMPLYPDSFAAQLAKAAGITLSPVPQNALMQVFGPARAYPTVSYYQALDPDNFLPEGFFKDRVVLVGLSLQAAPDIKAGGADMFATSYTIHSGALVAGVEVQATILDNLTRGLAILKAGTGATVLMILLGALIAVVVVHRDINWRTGAIGLVVVILFCLSSYALLRLGHVYLAPIGPSLAFLLITIGQSGFDYAAERRSRRQVTRAFSQYLSPEMVARLADDPSQLKLGGESRTLSILFCDVRGFTTIAERMKNDPQQLTSLINRLLTPLSDEILACGGTIDKYIGDCVMAFWNAPIDDPNHATNSVRAALQMLAAMDRFNEELRIELDARGEAPYGLRIGIGINTGECVVGNMGSTSRFDYSALGDAVNLAARLESESKPVAVPLLIGEETARMAAADFCIVELDRIIVKGRTVQSPVYTVLNTAPSPEIMDGHAGLLAARYEGVLSPSDPRFAELGAAIPELASYYSALKGRIPAMEKPDLPAV
jgi:adenylate cyclase